MYVESNLLLLKGDKLKIKNKIYGKYVCTKYVS